MITETSLKILELLVIEVLNKKETIGYHSEGLELFLQMERECSNTILDQKSDQSVHFRYAMNRLWGWLWGLLSVECLNGTVNVILSVRGHYLIFLDVVLGELIGNRLSYSWKEQQRCDKNNRKIQLGLWFCGTSP